MQNKNRQKCLFFCYICIDKQEQLFYNCVGDIMERQILHVDVNNALKNAKFKIITIKILKKILLFKNQ